MRYFIVLYAAGFALSLMHPTFYMSNLSLNAAAVLAGQPWRLVTFLICPPSTSILWGVLLLLVYYSLGNTLEQVWGTFRFNVFMFSGVLFHIAAAFLILFLTGRTIVLTPSNLNLSIFLAFALTFPEMQFYIYFVLPVKAKYLAGFYMAMEVYQFIVGGTAERITIVLSLLNLFLFLWFSGFFRRFSPSEIRRKEAFRRAADSGRGRSYPGAGRGSAGPSGREGNRDAKIIPVSRTAEAPARHRCTICGRTEKDAPDLEFRYCSKCAGDHEYCSEHLYTHVHITTEEKDPS